MKLIRFAQGRRVIQRTPDLGLTLRLRREQEPAPCPAPQPGAPELMWWHPGDVEPEGEWSASPLAVAIYPVVYCGDTMPIAMEGIAVARLSGRHGDVWWDCAWNGVSFDVPGTGDWGPYVQSAGEILVVRAPHWSMWHPLEMDSGVLEVWAGCAQGTPPSITLTLTADSG